MTYTANTVAEIIDNIRRVFQVVNEDDVLVALAQCGEDCMGNQVVGEESLAGYFSSAREAAAPIK